jgi:hypothetical protein
MAKRNTAYVWIFHDKREILVCDDPMPPVGGTFVGHYEKPWVGWGDADEVAKSKARELGYKVDYESRF